MKIGIFSGAIGFGGSQNTTAGIALGLARRGHAITLYIDRNRFRSFERINDLEVVDMPWHLYSSPVWSYFSIRNAIHAIRQVRKNRCDVMLCVGPGHAPTAMLISAIYKIPCIYYALFPSMILESRILRFRGITVANSEETRDSRAKFLKTSPENIPVVRARINLDMFSTKTSSTEKANGNGPISAVIMSRLEPKKSEGVLLTMESIFRLNKTGKRISLDVIGDGKNMPGIRAKADSINADLGSTVITLQGAVRSVQNELPKYDIALGIGRCAWEAMACGIPTVVVGEEGLGGIVCPENLEQLMRHNFTARGNSGKQDVEELADALEALIDNAGYRRKLGDFALDVIRKHYDVKVGVQQFEQIMQDSYTDASEQCPRLGPSLLLELAALKIYQIIRCMVMWILHPYNSARALHSLRSQTEQS